MHSLFLSVWNTWKKIAHFIALVQSRILLTLCYFILLLPFGMILTFFKDELEIRKKRTTNWRKVEENKLSLTDLREQY